MANFVLQLLRNSAVAENKAAAIALLEGKLESRKDGEMVLARYANGEAISAVLGIINKVGNKNVLTVLEDNVNAVPSKIADAIATAKSTIETAYKEADTALSGRITTLESAMGGVGAESVGTQISKAIAELDVTEIGGAGKFIQSVSEVDGKIAANAIDATAANIAFVDAEGHFEAVNVEAALAELYAGYTAADEQIKKDFAAADSALDAAYKAADDVVRGEFAAADAGLKSAYEAADEQIKKDFAAADKAINDKIGEVEEGKTVVEMIEAVSAAADAAHTKVAKAEGATHLTLTEATGEDGAVTYTIGENNIASADALTAVDGRLTTAEGEIDTLQGQVGEGTVDARIEAAKSALMGEVADSDAKTIAALNDKIEGVEAAAKSYELVAITENLGSNILKAYELHDEDGLKSGERIEIYKDSSLKQVVLDENQKLQFTYILNDGSESTVAVDVSSFLSESEFGNGLQVVDHKVSVKIDAASESYLTVSADGIKLSGIDAAIKAADDVVRGEFSAADAGLKSAYEAADEQIKKDFAAADAGLKTAYEAADSALDARVSTLEGLMDGEGSVANQISDAIEGLASEKTGDGTFVDVTVKQVNGVIESVTVAESNIAKADELDAAEEKITALETKVGNDTVSNQIDAKINALDADITSDNGTFVNVEVVEENGKITEVKVSENDIASAAALSTANGKITALETKVGNDTVSNQIDAKINALDVEDAAVAGEYVSSVSEADGKITVSRNKLLGAETDNALSLGVNGGAYMSTTIDCGTY